jgi:hypothetical protein
MNATGQNAKTLLEIFGAIERRDLPYIQERVDPAFEIHWPPSLPYGGSRRALPLKRGIPAGVRRGPLCSRLRLNEEWIHE